MMYIYFFIILNISRVMTKLLRSTKHISNQYFFLLDMTIRSTHRIKKYFYNGQYIQFIKKKLKYLSSYVEVL